MCIELYSMCIKIVYAGLGVEHDAVHTLDLEEDKQIEMEHGEPIEYGDFSGDELDSELHSGFLFVKDFEHLLT